jgi:UDP:flavonoid glycosyltransferase YjiC (YdhE family)
MAGGQRWAFFSHAYNLGDCSRAIEVAKAMRASGGEVRFFHHGGYHIEQIRTAGFAPVQVEPLVTEAQHRFLMDMDQHRAPIGAPMPFTEDQLIAMVEAELAAFVDWKPDGVFCGLNLSCLISVPHARLPMVTFVPTALCPAFFEQGLASFPNAMETNFVLRRLLPEKLKRIIINRVMLGDVAKKSATVFNRVRARYGLPPIANYTQLVRGDLTLLPDLPELSGLRADLLPAGYRYSGPVFARMDELPLPAPVARVLARPGTKIYCAMGSSGTPELLKQVVAILRSVPDFNVVCATTTILDPAELGAPDERFAAVRYLPAHVVCEQVDLAVTHGGQGTVQTAAWAGIPVVGIGFQWEQQANLDGLAQAGSGIRIPLHSVTAPQLLAAVARALTPGFRSSAMKLKALVRESDGPTNAVQLMRELAVNRAARS